MIETAQQTNSPRSPRPSVVAIIPARGGSKGVPRKNIRSLGGRPLIAYSIEIARRSRFISHVVVSTDDEEIAEVAVACGAEVPFIRPRGLAGDRANLEDVFSHTLQGLRDEGVDVQHWVSLYPTHPFRSLRVVDFLIEKLLSGCEFVQTATRVELSRNRFFVESQGRAQPLFLDSELPATTGRSERFRPSGYLIGQALRGGLRHYLHVLTDALQCVDIDSEEDFLFAEGILDAGLFQFETGT